MSDYTSPEPRVGRTATPANHVRAFANALRSMVRIRFRITPTLSPSPPPQGLRVGSYEVEGFVRSGRT